MKSKLKWIEQVNYSDCWQTDVLWKTEDSKYYVWSRASEKTCECCGYNQGKFYWNIERSYYNARYCDSIEDGKRQVEKYHEEQNDCKSIQSMYVKKV